FPGEIRIPVATAQLSRVLRISRLTANAVLLPTPAILMANLRPPAALRAAIRTAPGLPSANFPTQHTSQSLNGHHRIKPKGLDSDRPRMAGVETTVERLRKFLRELSPA